MQRKRKHRTFISVLLSFFLAVCLFLILFGSEILMGYLGKKTFYDSMTESKYIESAIGKMKTDVFALLEARAVPTEPLEEIIDTNLCYIEMRNYITGALEGKKVKVNATEFGETIENYLADYLASNQIYQTEGVRSTMDEIVRQAEKIYEKRLQPEFAVTFYEYNQSVRTPIIITMIVALVVSTGIIIVLFLLYHRKHRAVRYIMISAISAVIWNVMCGIFIGKADVLDSLQIGPEFYLDFVKAYIDKGLSGWWILCAIGTLVSMSLYATVKYLKHNMKNKVT